jgi:hypothetical protein
VLFQQVLKKLNLKWVLRVAQSGPGLLNSQAGSRAHFLMLAIKTSGKKNTCIEHWHDGTGFVCMLLLWYI